MQLSKKKLKRIEKKKKKLAALIEIAELNNKDRTELQLPSLCWPDGDKARMSDCQDTSTVENKPTLMQVDELSSYDGRGDSVMSSGSVSEDVEHAHKKKKKKKSKHHEEKEKRRSKTVDKGREEWPSLLKRKSSIELEIQKERPVKVLKRQFGEHDQHERPGSTSTPSYAEELAMFKVDLNRSKHKKEKKSRKDKVMETAEETTDSATPNSDSDKKKKKRKEQTEQSEEMTTEDQTQESDLDEKISLAKSEQSFEELKTLLRARKKQLKEIPYVRLKKTGKEADLECLSQRVPILPGDVQTFLLFSQLGSNSPRFPRWVELKKGDRISKTVLLVVDGLSTYDFLNQESSCPVLHGMDVKAEMVTPFCYGSTLVEELCAVPLSRQQTKDLEKRFGKEICHEALLTDRVIKVLRSAFSISSVPKTQSEAVEKKISVPTGDKFPRTELLLSAWQLIEEGYPLPYGSQELGDRYPDYVMTKDEYTEVTPSSPLWAVDCEMCLTRAGNELTRVSVVNEQHKTVYESFCVPRNPIINYLTEFSGITPEMLKGVQTRLEDIQRDLRELFPSDVILVGQSLNGDLHALKMMHPYVIDTSVIFNLTGNRKHKSKLSRLAQEFLNETIQQHGAAGHDSVEDSLAALKLVQYKLTKSVEFGDAVLSGLKEDAGNAYSVVHKEHKVEEFDDLKVEVGPTMATSLFKHITMHKRSVCVIGPEETLAEYSAFIAAARTENKEMIRTVSTESNVDTITRVGRECADAHFILAHTILSDEEDITHVNSWMEDLYNAPPFNALFIVVLAGSHNNNANGAALIKVKKPNLRLKKTRRAD